MKSLIKSPHIYPFSTNIITHNWLNVKFSQDNRDALRRPQNWNMLLSIVVSDGRLKSLSRRILAERSEAAMLCRAYKHKPICSKQT